MSQDAKDPVENEELELNPSPLPYRVSFKTKSIFLLVLFFGVGLYVYMVVERRVMQNRFLMHNEMAAIKLVETSVPSMMVHDPKAGVDVDLNSQLGTWTLLNIWATWCPPCKDEMPSLELLQKKLDGKLKIVALSMDEDLDAVNQFIALNKPSFQILWDKFKLSPIKFGVDKYPESFLISPDGVLTTQFSGPRDWASLHAVDYFSNIVQ